MHPKILGLYWGSIKVILRLYWGNMGAMLVCLLQEPT